MPISKHRSLESISINCCRTPLLFFGRFSYSHVMTAEQPLNANSFQTVNRSQKENISLSTLHRLRSSSKHWKQSKFYWKTKTRQLNVYCCLKMKSSPHKIFIDIIDFVAQHTSPWLSTLWIKASKPKSTKQYRLFCIESMWFA